MFRRSWLVFPRALTIDHRSAPKKDLSEQETKVINYYHFIF
jgi:hypothetical protein